MSITTPIIIACVAAIAAVWFVIAYREFQKDQRMIEEIDARLGEIIKDLDDIAEKLREQE